MAWLSGWKTRKSFSVSRPSGAVTDFQMKFTVHRSGGSDSGSDVYVGTDCQADYDDIRFTSSDGITLLPYWIEDSSASLATIWVKLDNIETSETTFYLYYNNPAAEAYENGDDTFIWYDGNEGLTYTNTKLANSQGSPEGFIAIGNYFYQAEQKTPTRIHQIDPSDGSATGEYFDFNSSDSTHMTSLAWDGDYLWGIDYATYKLHKIDLSSSLASHSADIVTTILVGNGEGFSGAPSAICFVTYDESTELLITEWASSGKVVIVDLSAAITDETIDGNILRTFYQVADDYSPGRIQGLFTESSDDYERIIVSGQRYNYTQSFIRGYSYGDFIDIPASSEIFNGLSSYGENRYAYFDFVCQQPTIYDGTIYFTQETDNNIEYLSESTGSRHTIGWNGTLESIVSDQAYKGTYSTELPVESHNSQCYVGGGASILEVELYPVSTDEHIYIAVAESSDLSDRLTLGIYNNSNWQYWDGSWHDTGVSISVGEWQTVKYIADGAGNIKLYIKETLAYDGSRCDNIEYFAYEPREGYGSDSVYVDCGRVRKYLSVEPTIGDWGDAEASILLDKLSLEGSLKDINVSRSGQYVSLNKLEAALSVKDIVPSVTLYETDFSGYTLDQQPSDWTKTWNATYGDFKVRDDGDLGGQCLGSSIFDSHSCYIAWDDIGTPTDEEVLCKCRMTTADPYHQSIGAVVRGSGELASSYCYEVLISAYYDTVQVRKHVDAVDYLLVSESFTFDSDTWYWVRFQVIGTSLKARVWEDGDEEPGTWLIETTDSDVTGAGWVGYVDKTSGYGYQYGDCDYFAVGLDGESPPVPDQNINLDQLSLAASVKSLTPILSEYIINLNKLSLIGSIKGVDPASGMEINLNCLSAKASLKNITVSLPSPATISLDKLYLEAKPKDLDIVFHLGSVDATLPALECDATSASLLSVDATLPGLECEANFGARLNVDAKLPNLEFEARMGSRAKDLKLPVIECEANLSENLTFSLDAKLPTLQLSDTRMGSRLDAMLPDLRIEASLVSDIILSLDKTLPGLTCEASAYCSNLGSVDAKLPTLLIDASLGEEIEYILDKMLPGLRCVASMYCSSLGNIDAVLPDLQIEANLYQEGTMSVDANLPALLMSGQGYGTGDGTGGGTISEKSRFEDYILRYSR